MAYSIWNYIRNQRGRQKFALQGQNFFINRIILYLRLSIKRKTDFILNLKVENNKCESIFSKGKWQPLAESPSCEAKSYDLSEREWHNPLVSPPILNTINHLLARLLQLLECPGLAAVIIFWRIKYGI